MEFYVIAIICKDINYLKYIIIIYYRIYIILFYKVRQYNVKQDNINYVTDLLREYFYVEEFSFIYFLYIVIIF